MEQFEPYQNEPYSDYSDPNVLAAYKHALAGVRAQFAQDYPLIIGGKEVETTHGFITSINPCNTQEVVGRSAKAKVKQVDAALSAAWEAFADWSSWPMAARSRAAIKLAAIMRRRKFELAAWETFEAGKNYLEAEADVAEAIDFCEYYAREALKLAASVPSYPYPGEENSSFLLPIGAGVVIPPWNFLLAILVGTAVGPVVVGNTVVIKPSPDTPVIAQKFMECVAEAGFPPGVFNLLTGEDKDIGDALVDHPKTRFINFTGSLATGLRIYERAAVVHKNQRWLKKVFAELGGKDTLIVDETADLELAAAAAVASAFGFQGQKCSALSRLIIVQDVYDELLAAVLAKTKMLSLGPAEENHEVCAVINQKAVDKILGYIERAKQDASLLCGGGRGAETGYFIEPTVFGNVSSKAALAREEVFGPVLAVLQAKDFAHALSLANDTDYGLTGGVFSKDRARLEQARKEFQVGNLYLNRKITGALVGVQPFGGFNLSGSNAKAGGPDYLRLFMEMKTVTERF